MAATTVSFRLFLCAVLTGFGLWTALPAAAQSSVPFIPASQLPGIGASRLNLRPDVIAERTERMISSQTFIILREPQALSGTRRVSGPALQTLFQAAEKKSGFPAVTLAAISLVESWGDPLAESPTGPKGIMQIARGTAEVMGLQVPAEPEAVEYLQQANTPPAYSVPDERMIPEKAIAAAGRYLARMEHKYGGQDWAIWAYHCGEGCVEEFQALAKRSGLGSKASVAEVFFSGSPAFRRELNQAIQKHMERDYSPTYYFRIRSAERLLTLYQRNPKLFTRLYDEHRNTVDPQRRAPHRLAVWLKPGDLSFRNYEDIRRALGGRLSRAFDDPERYGIALRAPARRTMTEEDWQATPGALGALLYIAYETRRLHEALQPKGERFQPIEVNALVRPLSGASALVHAGGASHSSGQVFDLAIAKLPPGERECLRFVLDDLGWDSQLGFVEHPGGVIHVGPAPVARWFFERVYREALSGMELPEAPELLSSVAN